MNSERSEKNRRIAEWIGEYGYVLGGDRQWHPRDFYSDEAASAMALEAMPWADLSKQDPTNEWRCDPLGGAEGPHGNGLSVYDLDRKTCIAEACIKLIEETK